MFPLSGDCQHDYCFAIRKTCESVLIFLWCAIIEGKYGYRTKEAALVYDLKSTTGQTLAVAHNYETAADFLGRIVSEGQSLSRADFQDFKRQIVKRGEAGALTPGGTIDLTGVHLDNGDFRGTDLRLLHLESAKLRLCQMNEANLEGVVLVGADLSGTVLDKANLDRADMRHVTMKSVDKGIIKSATPILRAQGDVIKKSERWQHEFSTRACFATFRGANLYGVTMERADFTGADLSNGFLASASAHECVFNDANLTGANFAKAAVVRCKMVTNSLPKILAPVCQFHNNQYFDTPKVSDLLRAKFKAPGIVKQFIADELEQLKSAPKGISDDYRKGITANLAAVGYMVVTTGWLVSSISSFALMESVMATGLVSGYMLRSNVKSLVQKGIAALARKGYEIEAALSDSFDDRSGLGRLKALVTSGSVAEALRRYQIEQNTPVGYEFSETGMVVVLDTPDNIEGIMRKAGLLTRENRFCEETVMKRTIGDHWPDSLAPTWVRVRKDGTSEGTWCNRHGEPVKTVAYDELGNPEDFMDYPQKTWLPIGYEESSDFRRPRAIIEEFKNAVRNAAAVDNGRTYFATESEAETRLISFHDAASAPVGMPESNNIDSGPIIVDPSDVDNPVKGLRY
ncbi:pentapeptide repeat-containing protein [Thalassospira xianhensis]|uniref:Pentapeptide repeat-containing protein n=1 Tax=Thalassospira xianhensis MCCC 1A02616 TaxID=1177929 RepID=A0A367U784_9PROT|nr:pentapeptide repeat-containing protein [Thalassospira xianhensis]RCK04155.1 hypothetical protein TH5_21505 [Thalassospira xianhensis MCCC 1A02616]